MNYRSQGTSGHLPVQVVTASPPSMPVVPSHLVLLSLLACPPWASRPPPAPSCPPRLRHLERGSLRYMLSSSPTRRHHRAAEGRNRGATMSDFIGFTYYGRGIQDESPPPPPCLRPRSRNGCWTSRTTGPRGANLRCGNLSKR